MFNLKQMAQTMAYLSEHDLLDYAALATKAAAAAESATMRFAGADQVSGKAHGGDRHALRTHIVHYAKTRETYVAYRKAGYSGKFTRKPTEEEITAAQGGQGCLRRAGREEAAHKSKSLRRCVCRGAEPKEKDCIAEYRPRP